MRSAYPLSHETNLFSFSSLCAEYPSFLIWSSLFYVMLPWKARRPIKFCLLWKYVTFSVKCLTLFAVYLTFSSCHNATSTLSSLSTQYNSARPFLAWPSLPRQKDNQPRYSPSHQSIRISASVSLTVPCTVFTAPPYF